MTTPGMLTHDAIRALSAQDLFPCAACPEHELMVVDVQVLNDGMLLRCPTEGCATRFATKDVTFMDDVARRKHGLLVEVAPE
jgi:hypothetical protein